MFSNLKGWARGVYHGLRPKYLQSYLDEFVFRFNRRTTRHAAFRSLFDIALRAKPVTYNILGDFSAVAHGDLTLRAWRICYRSCQLWIGCPIRMSETSNMLRPFFMLFGLIVLAASPAIADVAQEVTWDNLVPSTLPLEDPFAHLTALQRFDLGYLVDLRRYQVEGLGSEVSPDAEEAVELTYNLEREGLDVESLLAEYAAIEAQILKRNEAVVGELEGQLVRLAGYALPLEFSDTGVTEFLLVPYIGACIHVPPPPPNQMVFVRLNQTFNADDLYTPVWVTGRMTVKPSNKELSYVDGESNVNVGYSLDGSTVEPYEN